ncbi:hypothetical protein AA0119_g12859 [Alternaria tenuissima]|uniref:Uncharacterized protein n=1 Tax=Alternaria tenuissima TaxID=119927 RepID=A0A4V1X6D4_9PLEO|nr:hypothetical protein AA0115_g10835 [Alternaria tenuissima]RYN86473.1 hypothetical protein AA0119_g12859 [Alternaria tenuissima]RYO07628.1 hypothetical protein AA0121_g11710 [Alternaria tenuissima]RYO66098.1 hypothetical protein AA0116_g2884 [Alternaria tenuissima]
MVLEVFAALSLAGNIVQFVDFGGKLFTKARQVHHSADGTTKDYKDLEAATERLKNLRKDLLSSANTVSLASNTTSEETELASLAKDCASLACEFTNLLEKLKGRGRTGKWGSFLQAIRMALNETEVNFAKSRLKQFQSRVTVCLLTILSNNQSNVTRMLLELSTHVHGEETRAKDLLTMRASVTSKLDSIKSLIDTAKEESDDVSSKLGSIASTLSDWATTGNQLATETRILKSLRFEAMNVRHAQIPEAHSKTFEWAYTSRPTSGRLCTQYNFAEWLRSGNGHYWVAGKAGSGKSTLIKFLYDNPRTLLELEHWCGSKELVTAGFFFWNSGTERQKSVEGLLQSLLYEILRKCPGLIPIAAPERWQERSSYHTKSAPWFHKEMIDTFRRIQERGTISAKFCIFIDGLDEYDGDHSDLTSILHDLTTSHDVKLCVSSRPWNIFQDAFGRDVERRLFLEDLTEADIEQFVRDKLESSAHFMSLTTMDNRYRELVEEIVCKADGVFFWVFLIVRSLLQGLVNCDRFSELQRRIRLLPSKLEDYFLHTLSTTDETYAERAAETFDIALRASEPLSLLTYSFLDEEDPYHGINTGIKALSRQEILYRLRTMKRRLNARCNGLLEITIYHISTDRRELLRTVIDDLWDSPVAVNNLEITDLFHAYKVDFLHRTVRDFLNTDGIRKMIDQRILCDFQPLSAICRAMLAQIKALPMSVSNHCEIERSSVLRLIEELFSYARASDEEFQRPETRSLDELERTLLALSPVWQTDGKLVTLFGNYRSVNEANSFFESVVRNGLCGYVSRKLRSSSEKRSRPSVKKLLTAALLPREDIGGRRHYPPMLSLLMRTFEEQRTKEWTRIELPPLWTEYLASLPDNWRLSTRAEKEAQLQMIHMLLEIGADPKEQRDGRVVWESTLEQLESAVRKEQVQLSKIEELELIERYKNMFLACDLRTGQAQGGSGFSDRVCTDSK